MELFSADTGETEGWDRGLESVVSSVLADFWGVVSVTSIMTHWSSFFCHLFWLSTGMVVGVSFLDPRAGLLLTVLGLGMLDVVLPAR